MSLVYITYYQKFSWCQSPWLREAERQLVQPIPRVDRQDQDCRRQAARRRPAPRRGAPACRCCGSPRTVRRGEKHGNFLHRDFEYFACADCDFLFVEPFAGYAIYNDDYYQGRGPDPYVDYASEYADYRRTDRGHEFEDLARIAGDFFSPSAHPAAAPASPLAWLDFGCGAGGLLKFLREGGTLAGRPLELTGHDVGSYAEKLKQRDGFRVLDLAELTALPDAQFDLISMIEVIEHIPEPSPTIALAARLLKPGGLLILTTGNMDCPVARRHGLNFGYVLPEIHVSHFTPRCLEKLYVRHGLRPHAVRYAGVVRFKLIKTIRHPALKPIFRLIARLPGVVPLLDSLYGVSAMPCAVKAAS
jgi:SAM-dependent methyltransferase